MESIVSLICLSELDYLLRLSLTSRSLWSMVGLQHNKPQFYFSTVLSTVSFFSTVSVFSTVKTDAWACRVFVAQREDYNNTWINTYAPFVDLYAADDTECTSQEVGLRC